MSKLKFPYKRIIRPIHEQYYGQWHLLDTQYCSERQELIHAYHLIQEDYKQLLDYIEFHDDNKETYSHRTFELLLRICTEFENNSKGILRENVYSKPEREWNITDYYKINKASKLNEYSIKLNLWRPLPLQLRPFIAWNTEEYHALSWYQAYNKSKHNRSANFNLASLENVTNSLAGLFVILASQFAQHVFSPFQMNMGYTTSKEDGETYFSVQDGLFSIRFPNTWNEEDHLERDWQIYTETPDEYLRFNFD